MLDLNFRKANESDIQKIADFVDEAKKVMDSQGIFQWDEVYPVKEDFENDFKQDSLFVGEIEGSLAVVFVLNDFSDQDYQTANWQFPEKSYKILHRICVNPKFQNKGVGTATMLYIQNLLKKMHIQAIRLDVFSENPYSQKLYDNLGFVKTGEANWRKGLFYLMEKYL